MRPRPHGVVMAAAWSIVLVQVSVVACEAGSAAVPIALHGVEVRPELGLHDLAIARAAEWS